jgi:hypothetical protein
MKSARGKMNSFRRALFIACVTDLATLVFLPFWPNGKYAENHLGGVFLVLLPLLLVRTVTFFRSDTLLVRLGLVSATVATILFLFLDAVD